MVKEKKEKVCKGDVCVVLRRTEVKCVCGEVSQGLRLKCVSGTLVCVVWREVCCVWWSSVLLARVNIRSSSKGRSGKW